jgi:hypothetical protein
LQPRARLDSQRRRWSTMAIVIDGDAVRTNGSSSKCHCT